MLQRLHRSGLGLTGIQLLQLGHPGFSLIFARSGRSGICGSIDAAVQLLL